jgi:hypothetical protein
MSGERASSVRKRLAGQICCLCKRPLPLPHTRGEKKCAACSRHHVYMNFMLRDGWYCQFMEADAKTSLPRKVTVTDPERLFEMAERGGCSMDLETRHAIMHAIDIGRGGVWLNLTDEQYNKLRTARSSKSHPV